MAYFYFPKLLHTQHIQHIRLETDPYLVKPTKVEALDTEIDLTYNHAIKDTKEVVENIVSECYNKTLVCFNYWISVSKPGECVVEHQHVDPGSPAVYSAVLYLQANSLSGELLLVDYNIHITPSTGDLVVFPASCYHSVDENKSTDPRICVAFDFKEIV